jgi:hypothetical protein
MLCVGNSNAEHVITLPVTFPMTSEILFKEVSSIRMNTGCITCNRASNSGTCLSINNKFSVIAIN